MRKTFLVAKIAILCDKDKFKVDIVSNRCCNMCLKNGKHRRF